MCIAGSTDEGRNCRRRFYAQDNIHNRIFEGMYGYRILGADEVEAHRKISIEEMTAKADVGRSTYFRYFKSKEEVLSFKIQCLWERFFSERRADEIRCDARESIRLLFEFCLSVKSVLDLLYSANHQNVILSFYLQSAAPTIARSGTETYYFARFITYGLFGLISAWVLRDCKETPDEMARIVCAWRSDADLKSSFC